MSLRRVALSLFLAVSLDVPLLSLLPRVCAHSTIGSDGHEVHEGHTAEHTTSLSRGNNQGSARRRARHHHASKPTSMARHHGTIKAAAGHHLNATTPLQDMRSEYIGSIGVGTSRHGGPLFQARVVFDTGSTNLWVASVLCTETPCEDKTYYDPAMSLTRETYSGDDSDIDIMFGTGELRGPMNVDDYRVGPMIVKQQPFAMIREMKGEVFSSFPFEGILGLGFKSLSFAGITPFFDRVIQQGQLKNNEFAFYLNSDNDKPSALLWGGVDKNLYEGSIRMFPVVQAHYWAIELLDLKLGGQSLLEGSEGSWKVIIDSGTTYFTLPKELHSRVVRDEVPSCTCSEAEKKYPPLVYKLRGANGLIYDLKVGQETYMIGADDSEGGPTDCRPAFMALDVNERYGPAVILGEVFMRHFFTVFRRGSGHVKEARIGIARAKVGVEPQVDASLLTASSVAELDADAEEELRSAEAFADAQVQLSEAKFEHGTMRPKHGKRGHHVEPHRKSSAKLLRRAILPREHR